MVITSGLSLFFHHLCVGTSELYFYVFYLMSGFFPSTLCLWDSSRLLFVYNVIYSMSDYLSVFHPFCCWWVFGLFPAMNIPVQMSWCSCIDISFGHIHRTRAAGYKVSVCPSVVDYVNPSFRMIVSISVFPAGHGNYCWSSFLAIRGHVALYNFTYFCGYIMTSQSNFNVHFLCYKWTEHFFLCLLTVCM